MRASVPFSTALLLAATSVLHGSDAGVKGVRSETPVFVLTVAVGSAAGLNSNVRHPESALRFTFQNAWKALDLEWFCKSHPCPPP
jgi:hypothetical protein